MKFMLADPMLQSDTSNNQKKKPKKNFTKKTEDIAEFTPAEGNLQVNVGDTYVMIHLNHTFLLRFSIAKRIWLLEYGDGYVSLGKVKTYS